MPKFGNKSRERLDTCDIRLRLLFEEVVKHVDCTILEGIRSREKQEEYFESGRSKVRWPKSKHNLTPSKAVDVAPWRSGVGVPWPDHAASYLRKKFGREPMPAEVKREESLRYREWYVFIGFVRGIASQMGIPVRCGADWDGDFEIRDQNFHDLPHFELSIP